ncbi:MAG: cyclic nucleotide-binding domain-containing protein [Desulfobacterales bacterium]|nr:cyclic nucleotide-binding domain-containing protein [Desulfobacterales bacterium]
MSQKLELLNQVDIFKSLDNSAQNRLESIMEKRVISAGEDLAIQGGQALFFFILISGRVLLSTKEEKAVIFKKPGDFIGFELLSLNGKYTNTLKSLIDGEVFFLNREKFLEMIHGDATMVENIMSLWGNYLLKTAPFIKKLDFTGAESIY